MARRPDGSMLEDEDAGLGLEGEEAQFARGLEAIIDRALQRTPRGQRFAYGIHQELSAPMAEHLRRRYLAAGWGSVSLNPGATGAMMLVLAP